MKMTFSQGDLEENKEVVQEVYLVLEWLEDEEDCGIELMRKECHFCHLKTVENLLRKFNPGQQKAEIFMASVHRLLSENGRNANPILARDVHRMASVFFKNHNLYALEKIQANMLLLNQYAYWQAVVQQSEDPFNTAAKLAVIGNIIDYGAHSINGCIASQIESLFTQDLTVDMTTEMQREVSNAKSVLYLGDNCGEIVFDKLFIQTMEHNHVTYVVRGKPVINDVTIEDADQTGMHDVCHVITNGNDAPSTLLEFSSDEFISAFNNADLIISKGQGNFEGLMDNDHGNIFFMLIAKCKPMAELLGVKKGDMVISKG